MSKTLKLIDHLLARSQHLQECGRPQEAIRALTCIADFTDLPAKAIVEMQSRLAQLYLDQRRFKRACLACEKALRYESNNAQLHLLLATAISSSKNLDPARALRHYHRSLELQADQPECLAACGVQEIRLGRRKQGLEHCRRAAELAPDDFEVIRKAAKGFRLANQADEARRLLLAARFRNSKDARFQSLWRRDRFRQVRKNQEAESQRFTLPKSSSEPVILSFPGGGNSKEALPRKTIRHDSPADISPPRGPVHSDKKHAQ